MALPAKTPNLRFRWRDFVPSIPTKCFPACVSICAKYWLRYEPEMDIPIEIAEYEEALGDTIYSNLGLSTERLRQVMKKDAYKELDGERLMVGLTIEIMAPLNLEALYPFFLEEPQIPLIVSFNKGITELNKPSDSHAVIIYSIDYKTEKIFVIDPVKENLKEPFPYDFKRFNLGWENCENLTFIVAPLNTLNLISGGEVKVIRQTSLERFK